MFILHCSQSAIVRYISRHGLIVQSWFFVQSQAETGIGAATERTHLALHHESHPTSVRLCRTGIRCASVQTQSQASGAVPTNSGVSVDGPLGLSSSQKWAS